MNIEQLLVDLNNRATQTIILEPQYIFNQAIIGYDDNANKLIYSYELMVDAWMNVLIEEGGLLYDEALEQAMEHIHFNTLTVGGFFLRREDDDE